MTITGNEGGWHLMVGDPDAIGWIIFIGYLVASLTCWRSWRASRSEYHRLTVSGATGARDQRLLATWWLGLAILLALLGLNKQLDLQTLMTQIGKQTVLAHGWYAQRRAIQSLFVVALGTVMLTAIAAIAIRLRVVAAHIAPALIGLGLLFGFVVLRAFTFHVLRGHYPASLAQFARSLELIALVPIVWNAYRASTPTGGTGG